MNPVSPEFLTALRGPHQMVVEVDVLQNGQTIVSGLQVVDGTVTLDAGAATYATCEITTVYPGKFPTTGRLTVELAVRRGIVGHRPTPELVPLGVFKVIAFDLDAESGELRLSGMDRSKFALDARLEDDYAVAAGTLAVDVVSSLIATAVPHAQRVMPAGVHTVPASVFEVKTAPWTAVQELVAAIGKQPRFDGQGTFRLFDAPNTASPPAWTVDEGENGVLVSAAMSTSEDGVFNRIIAASPPTDTGTVYKAVATDTTSTARYGGPFGRKPDWIESDLFTSDAMCAAAADARMASILGSSQSVSFTAVPNCALVPGDVIVLRNQQLGLDTKHVIEKLTIGLTASAPMAATTRVAL